MFLLIVIAAVIGPLAWVDFRLFRAMRRRGARRGWLILLSAFAVCGFVAGGFLATVEYPWSAEFHACGLPFPGAFSHLEDGVWVCYIIPAPELSVIANGVFFVLVSVLIGEAAYFAWRFIKGVPGVNAAGGEGSGPR